MSQRLNYDFDNANQLRHQREDLGWNRDSQHQQQQQQPRDDISYQVDESLQRPQTVFISRDKVGMRRIDLYCFEKNPENRREQGQYLRSWEDRQRTADNDTVRVVHQTQSSTYGDYGAYGAYGDNDVSIRPQNIPSQRMRGIDGNRAIRISHRRPPPTYEVSNDQSRDRNLPSSENVSYQINGPRRSVVYPKEPGNDNNDIRIRQQTPDGNSNDIFRRKYEIESETSRSERYVGVDIVSARSSRRDQIGQKYYSTRSPESRLRNAYTRRDHATRRDNRPSYEHDSPPTEFASGSRRPLQLRIKKAEDRASNSDSEISAPPLEEEKAKRKDPVPFFGDERVSSDDPTQPLVFGPYGSGRRGPGRSQEEYEKAADTYDFQGSYNSPRVYSMGVPDGNGEPPRRAGGPPGSWICVKSPYPIVY